MRTIKDVCDYWNEIEGAEVLTVDSQKIPNQAKTMYNRPLKDDEICCIPCGSFFQILPRRHHLAHDHPHLQREKHIKAIEVLRQHNDKENREDSEEQENCIPEELRKALADLRNTEAAKANPFFKFTIKDGFKFQLRKGNASNGNCKQVYKRWWRTTDKCFEVICTNPKCLDPKRCYRRLKRRSALDRTDLIFRSVKQLIKEHVCEKHGLIDTW